MSTCKKCGENLTNGARECAQCKAPVKSSNKLGWVILVVVIAFVWVKILNSSESKPAEPAKPKTEAQLKEDAAFQATVAVLQAIKSKANDPASVAWEEVYRNADASVVCVKFRAKNGFGALVLTQIAVTKNKSYTDVKSWNKHCAGEGFYDEMKAKYGVD